MTRTVTTHPPAPACSGVLNGTGQRWTCLRRHTATSRLLASAAFQLASAALVGPVNFCTCCSWIPHWWSAMMIMVMMMTKHEWEPDRALDLHTKNTHIHWCGSLATSGWFFQSLCSSALQIPSSLQLLGQRIWGFQKRASLESSTRCGARSFSGSIAVWRMVQSSWRRQWQWWWFWSMARCRLSSQPRAAVDTGWQTDRQAAVSDFDPRYSYVSTTWRREIISNQSTTMHLQGPFSHLKINKRKPICIKLCVANICYYST